MIFLIFVTGCIHILFGQCCSCGDHSSLNSPLSGGYSTMSVTDPDTGKVYKQIDDGSGKPQWIEENNMCTKKYIDGLGYVSCPSPDWKPGCGPTILKEPPKGVQKQLDQMGKCGMFPNMFESSGESSNSDCASQQVPLASYSQTPSSSSSQTEPSSGRSEPRSSRKSSSRCPRSARNSERDAIRRGGVNW
ncbi:uncharacterized protein MONOS_1733 [Monocercomonoides exilis]|uniref:uncharacterized protein n=1 Tax=Monocercomonoides exilis TaxID=2049356 RepID=UPI0035594608|nr:hypothetical protein MONOS_1733 [Monocercomonoides exilis]|eukprot:MONOS_1733.1-p1 / transcript=MONOS_1733.1 / gene=MONOS_1733 / organism=Monocercomonoides_exilis_PA203 / gene_product=unspecified product / transcript_product=unspecified product / location=Mono_scaffold00032:82711-83414(+) / protein_length=190 / sequence_SO=supercontig / SO=protein_coding / is_pseudo=false